MAKTASDDWQMLTPPLAGGGGGGGGGGGCCLPCSWLRLNEPFCTACFAIAFNRPPLWLWPCSMSARAGYAAEVALCSRAGLFLGCDASLSPRRGNAQVFAIISRAAPRGSSARATEFECALRACSGTYLCAGSREMEHEREVGTRLEPFYWKLAVSRKGFVGLWSESRGAFLRNDVSLRVAPSAAAGGEGAGGVSEVFEGVFEDMEDCMWLLVPVPLKCAEGQAESSFSVTRVLHWGHESVVLHTEFSSLHQPNVAKSIPCERAPAMRRIDALLYQMNMPQAADSSDLLCPTISKMTSVSPSFFYIQKKCFRSLENIFFEHALIHNESGMKHLPLLLTLEIMRRLFDIISCLHTNGYVLLDACPSSFCESQHGIIHSLMLTDMKNAMKLEPMTYSTPASFLTKSGGRFGVPTGLFVMVPQPSLFLGHLHAHCLYSAPEVLQTPGSVGVAADIFSLACIFSWMVTGAAPCVHMSPDILKMDVYSDHLRAIIPSLVTAMNAPTQQGDYLVPDSSAASSAIAAATRDVPALTKLVLAALSFEREQRPSLAEFRACVEESLVIVQNGLSAEK